MSTKTKEKIAEPKSNWQPRWVVDVGHDCQCGIAMDDHCYVVLCPDLKGNWKPSSHIPTAVAEFLNDLIDDSNC